MGGSFFGRTISSSQRPLGPNGPQKSQAMLSDEELRLPIASIWNHEYLAESDYRPFTFFAIPGIISVHGDLDLLNAMILDVSHGHQTVRDTAHFNEPPT